MRRIVFTGGGTGGHIIPNVAILKKLKKEVPDIDILYIGSKKGPESKMIPDLGIKYKGVSTGKLRRYFSFQNFIDFFRIPIGAIKSFFILRKFKPNVVFSKGGFVSIPVVYAAHFLKIPIVLHESDISPGLANKLSSKKAHTLCLAYKESEKYFPKEIKKVITGNPVRENILNGDNKKAYKNLGFSSEIPTILIMGGSQGAQHINKAVFNAVQDLTKDYQVIHICGKGKLPKNLSLPGKEDNRFKTFEYIDKELADYYSITDLVICRSGANSLAEIDALEIPAILVPIGEVASRGEQMLNALNYQELHHETVIIPNNEFNKISLLKAINQLLPFDGFQKKIKEHLKKSAPTEKIINVLLGLL